MKSLFTLVLLSAAVLAKSAPTETHPSKPAPVKAFEASFGKEKQAVWTINIAGYQVAFEHKGQHITAEYNAAGKLLWYKKHIASTQLPTALQLALKNRLGKFWIADVVEQSGAAGATYELIMENGYQQLKLNAKSGAWQTIKTTNKA